MTIANDFKSYTTPSPFFKGERPIFNAIPVIETGKFLRRLRMGIL